MWSLLVGGLGGLPHGSVELDALMVESPPPPVECGPLRWGLVGLPRGSVELDALRLESPRPPLWNVVACGGVLGGAAPWERRAGRVEVDTPCRHDGVGDQNLANVSHFLTLGPQI